MYTTCGIPIPIFVNLIYDTILSFARLHKKGLINIRRTILDIHIIKKTNVTTTIWVNVIN